MCLLQVNSDNAGVRLLIDDLRKEKIIHREHVQVCALFICPLIAQLALSLSLIHI